MSRLVGRVYVDGHGWFGPGDKVPAAAAKLITNPKAWDEAPAVESPLAEADVQPSGDDTASIVPARAGKGSSKDAWVSYAALHDVKHDPDASRDEIIAAVESAGVPVE